MLLATVGIVGSTVEVTGDGGDNIINVYELDPSTVRVVVDQAITDLPMPTNYDVYVNGKSGNDQIIIRSSVQAPTDLRGGSGHDIIQDGPGNGKIRGGSGNDRIWGTGGNDTLWGGSGNDLIYGGDGDDKMRGGPGDDLQWGGEGNDHITTGSGNLEVAYGEGGNDVMVAQAVAYLDGGDGNDVLKSSNTALNQIMVGGAGDDTIRGKGGEDILIGGELTHSGPATPVAYARYSLILWTSVHASLPFANRVNAMQADTTAPINASLITDSAVDKLYGDSGSEWFLADSGDVENSSSNDLLELV